MNQNTIPTVRLKAVRLSVKRALGLGSGHACEAVAAALGHRSHAALAASAGRGGEVAVAPHAGRFEARLAELGHAFAPGVAATALAVAFGQVPDDVAADAGTTKLLRIADCITGRLAGLAIVHPAARDVVLALQPIPDAGVARIAIGKDTLRWNPAYVEGLGGNELEFVLAAAAIHRACLHPLRQGARDPGFWALACELAVNDFLVRGVVGKLPWGGNRDKRHTADSDPEAIYERLINETRMQPAPAASVSFETWKARGPSRPRSVAALASEWFEDRGPFARSGLLYGTVANRIFLPFETSVAEAVRRDPGRPHRRAVDGDAAAFGDILARKVAGLSEWERAVAVSRLVHDAVAACADTVSLGLVRELSGDPRIGLREDMIDEVSYRYLQPYSI